MRVRSRLRVSVSKSTWSFWTPSMNSSSDSSPVEWRERDSQEEGVSLRGPGLQGACLQGAGTESGLGARERVAYGEVDRGIQNPESDAGIPKASSVAQAKVDGKVTSRGPLSSPGKG